MRSKKSKNRDVSAITILVLMLVSGCAVGPNYKPPEVRMPDVWGQQVAKELTGDSALETWWTAFDDPLLEEMVDYAAASNLDLHSAAARVYEAMALRGVVTGDLLPQVFVDADVSREQLSETIVPAEIALGTTYGVGVSFNWEIDVFGRIRRSVEAATARLDASVEDYRDVMVVLYAAVAGTYVSVRELQARIEYAEANVEAQRSSLRLTQSRASAGLSSGVDVAQAESNLANTEARIPALRIGLQLSLNRLAVLLGLSPTDFGRQFPEIMDVKAIPQSSSVMRAGVPADLLRRRPDVRRAERELAAQTALIGVATADLYPTFSLKGALGFASGSAGDLFSSDSVTWSLIPGLRWQIFSGGRIQNRIRVEESRAYQALMFYQQTLLIALEEVENALVSYELERIRRDRLRTAVAATARTIRLVRVQYTAGLIEFQSFLDAQRQLALQQDELAASEAQVMKNVIDLNRALGGGWSPDVDVESTSEAAEKAIAVEQAKNEE